MHKCLSDKANNERVPLYEGVKGESIQTASGCPRFRLRTYWSDPSGFCWVETFWNSHSHGLKTVVL